MIDPGNPETVADETLDWRYLPRRGTWGKQDYPWEGGAHVRDKVVRTAEFWLDGAFFASIVGRSE